MMSRCILRSYADGDNGYRTEIKEGKVSERQKVAARAAWLRGGAQAGVFGRREAVSLWNIAGHDKNLVVLFLLARLVWSCAHCFRHVPVLFLTSFHVGFSQSNI